MLAERLTTGSTNVAPARVERSAIGAAIVHCPREPIRNQRTGDENTDEDGEAQQSISQLYRLSCIPRR